MNGHAAPAWHAPLVRGWVAAAAYLGVVLLALAPLAAAAATRPVWLLYLCGPAYMAHQVEEHWGDRFRHFVNDRVLGGREALTTNAIWWINVPGVWGVNLAALYAAVALGAGAGLAAPYLMLVNAAGHAAAALRFGYNPGLATALLIFVPLGIVSLLAIPATLTAHAVGLAIAVLIHLAIIAFILWRVRA